MFDLTLTRRLLEYHTGQIISKKYLVDLFRGNEEIFVVHGHRAIHTSEQQVRKRYHGEREYKSIATIVRFTKQCGEYSAKLYTCPFDNISSGEWIPYT